MPASAAAPIRNGPEGGGHLGAQAAHLAHVRLAVQGVHDAAGAPGRAAP